MMGDRTVTHVTNLREKERQWVSIVLTHRERLKPDHPYFTFSWADRHSSTLQNPVSVMSMSLVDTFLNNFVRRGYEME